MDERRGLGERFLFRLALLVPVFWVAGCGNLPQADVSVVNAEAEPNDGFDEANEISFGQSGLASIKGGISRIDDVDVYDLGPFGPGDVIEVDLDRVAAGLDAAVALFDADGRLVRENDNEDVSAGIFDPRLIHAVRHRSDRYYLAISRSPARFRLGAYRVDLSIDRGLAVPRARSQTVLLDFDGGVAKDPVLGTIMLDAFDAADIASDYKGQTEEIRDVIIATVEANYERFNIIVRTTLDPELPEGAFSTIFFGGFNEMAFGLSQAVDPYNENPSDDAVIFTESFGPDAFGFVPTPTELGVAIGNVASHEGGHLFGLNHVIDATLLMDERSPAFVLLGDQEFRDGPLSENVFPLGSHDSALLLVETVGRAEGP